MGPLELTLGAAALLIGATGTFSPCGLSVIDTIGPIGHSGGRRTTLAACAAFLPGAIVGGLLTFGLLAAVGGLLHGAGGDASYVAAAAIADLRGGARSERDPDRSPDPASATRSTGGG